MKLSVVIIAFNEENNIQRCLESVQDIADEIVVADSGSVDKTKLVCSQFGAKIYNHSFQSYGLQKEFATGKASNDHILSLDADEALDKTLVGSIGRVKMQWEKDCYAFNRITNFCGKWILHGEWYPDKVLRLFDRTKAQWAGNVHEKVIAYNPHNTGFLKGELLHYSYRSMDHFRQKTERYAAMGAVELFNKNLHPGFYHFYIKPAYRFLNAFVLQRGFLDGYAGYDIARMTANRLYLKFDKLKRMHEQKSNSPANI